MTSTSVAQNLVAIRQRISQAAGRAKRRAEDITLMAVTKTQPVELIVEAYQNGIRFFGENRVQEFAEKRERLQSLHGAVFALIGKLQSNKVNKAIELFSQIHSLDSLALAERIHASMARAGKPPIPVLIEINTGDAAKGGIPFDSSELADLLAAAGRLSTLRVRGLLTIPALTDDPEGARPYFRRLRELRDRMNAQNIPGISMDTLSMGMSNDFEVAVEEGSTFVRLGTAIFGRRQIV